jgi:hypothetical protein
MHLGWLQLHVPRLTHAINAKIIDKPHNFIQNETQKSEPDYIDICKIKSKKSDNIDKET